MLFAIVAAWLAYKKATESNRNGLLWGFIGVVVFLGTQFAVGLAIGLGILLSGGDDTTIVNSTLIINIVAVLASFLTTFGLLYYLNRPQKVDDYTAPPPPPSDFN